MEDDRLVDAVEELRQEARFEGLFDGRANLFFAAPFAGDFLNGLAADVRRHHDNRVREIDGAPLAVGQPTVVEHLQQHVEDVAMRLFHFVEQDDGVRATANRLGQPASFLVTDVSRRRSDQPADGVLLHELAHVDANHRLITVEQHLGQRLAEFGFAHAGRAQEDERADRPVRVLQARATPTNGVRYRFDRFVLADDALVQTIFEDQQFGLLGFHHSGHRDAGPRTDDLGDFFRANFSAQQLAARVLLFGFRFFSGSGLFELRDELLSFHL